MRTSYATEQKNKKQRKVVIDSNEAFATLDKVMATKALVVLQQPLWDRAEEGQGGPGNIQYDDS